MWIPLLIALVTVPPVSAPTRMDRLVALARLDAAVRYFHPKVATGPSNWDSLFAANVVRIADAPNATAYARWVGEMMAGLHDDVLLVGGPLRALKYNGFPSPTFAGSGGYGLLWRGATLGDVTHRIELGENVHVDVRVAEVGDTTARLTVAAAPTSAEWRAAYPTAGYRILGA